MTKEELRAAFADGRTTLTEQMQRKPPLQDEAWQAKAKWLSFRRQRSYDTGELEYRTWPTATVSDARRVVGLIRERHQAVMRKYSSARA